VPVRVFLSYSSDDRKFAGKIKENLEPYGLTHSWPMKTSSLALKGRMRLYANLRIAESSSLS
jgi:hypothetical protein